MLECDWEMVSRVNVREQGSNARNKEAKEDGGMKNTIAKFQKRQGHGTIQLWTQVWRMKSKKWKGAKFVSYKARVCDGRSKLNIDADGNGGCASDVARPRERSKERVQIIMDFVFNEERLTISDRDFSKNDFVLETPLGVINGCVVDVCRQEVISAAFKHTLKGDQKLPSKKNERSDARSDCAALVLITKNDVDFPLVRRQTIVKETMLYYEVMDVRGQSVLIVSMYENKQVQND